MTKNKKRTQKNKNFTTNQVFVQVLEAKMEQKKRAYQVTTESYRFKILLLLLFWGVFGQIQLCAVELKISVAFIL